jgi:hypothetical protein
MNKAVAKIDPDSQLPLVQLTGYRALDADPEMIKEVLRENMDSGVTEFDLDRVSVPSGGGTAWEVPTLSGPKNMDAIEGVMVWYRDARAYWEQSYDLSGGGSPPDCSSTDLVVGTGKPGGDCNKCPLAQFGSAEKGKGQACKQMRQIYMLREDSVLPTVITAPPTSLRAMRNFNMKLSGSLVPYYGVTVQLKLEKDKNENGIEYAKIQPKAISRLNEEQFEQVKGIRQALIGTLDGVDLSPRDYQAVND